MARQTAAETVGRSLGRKTEQVIAGAREVFLAQGFEGASVDDIARAAQVSKATLYAYFPDKSALFSRVIKEECARQATHLEELVQHDAPAPQVLSTLAERYLTFLLTPFAKEIYRVCVAEAQRFPVLAREFYTSGPGRAHHFLADYLRAASQRGELSVDDALVAADQLTELCRAGIFLRYVLGVEQDTSQAEIQRLSSEAVKTFLARYGT